MVAILLVEGVLNHIKSIATGFLPALEGAPAEVACARGDSLGMESRILVKGNEVCCVGGAENVAAVSAVMPSEEETEGGAACWGVAVGGGGVGLWNVSMVLVWWTKGWRTFQWSRFGWPVTSPRCSCFIHSFSASLEIPLSSIVDLRLMGSFMSPSSKLSEPWMLRGGVGGDDR